MALKRAAVKDEAENQIEGEVINNEEDDDPVAQMVKGPSALAEVENAEEYKPIQTREGAGTAVSTGFAATAEADGFGGVELGFGSFPIITLKDDSFRIDGEKDSNVSEGFDCILMSSNKKLLYKAEKRVGNEVESLLEYSYDGVLTLGGDDLATIKKGWEDRGFTVTVKTYLEAAAQMVGGDHDGDFFLLSISPASRTRFGGYLYMLENKDKLKAREVVTHCGMGTKIGSGSTAFYPWTFKVNREATKEMFGS